jgi:hypothetical protein
VEHFRWYIRHTVCSCSEDPTVTNTPKNTSSSILHNYKWLAHESYNRELSLLHSVRFVHTYLPSNIRYRKQMLSMSEDYTRQLNIVTACFICAGETFRVPLPTRCLPPIEGGTDLIDVLATYHGLFICRCLIPLQKRDTMRARRSKIWNRYLRISNAPDMRIIDRRFAYIRLYIHEIWYMRDAARNATDKELRTTIHAHLRK